MECRDQSCKLIFFEILQLIDEKNYGSSRALGSSADLF
jgi:hypothetical protein